MAQRGSQPVQENICSRHQEMMKMFCCTDQQRICFLCSLDQHKGHETVVAAARNIEFWEKEGLSEQTPDEDACIRGPDFCAVQRTKTKTELEGQNILQRIQGREKDVKVLQQEVEAINRSADKAVKDSEKIFTQLIRLMEKRSSDVKQQLRSQQETEVRRVKGLQEKLEQEIAELEQLSHEEDHSRFLRPSLSRLSESESVIIRPVRYFEGMTAAVSKLRDKIQDVLGEKCTNRSVKVTSEPMCRAQFLQYSCQITLDPNTANQKLLLSEGSRKVTDMTKEQSYSHHPDRFTKYLQVLTREGLTGRCYWEVEWSGIVSVAVAYKKMCRTGSQSGFGDNDKSWALYCNSNVYRHNGISTFLTVPQSSRVGVYLDHGAGLLSFYSVSTTTDLLHRVQTTFTQPLHAGLYVCGGAAELC